MQDHVFTPAACPVFAVAVPTVLHDLRHHGPEFRFLKAHWRNLQKLVWRDHWVAFWADPNLAVCLGIMRAKSLPTPSLK